MRPGLEEDTVEIRCYLNGVEISKIKPPLPFLGQDDWFPQFLHWVSTYHDEKTMWGVCSTPLAENGHMVSVWVGTPPPSDAVPLGGQVTTGIEWWGEGSSRRN